MTRRISLGVCAWAVSGYFGSAVAADRPVGQPNVVLCMTDDQGWGDVSYNGLKKIRTPNLDAMAAIPTGWASFGPACCSASRRSPSPGP